MGLQIDRLKQLRKECGYTQNEFATALNISRSALAMWEIGRTEPSSDMYSKMSFLLHCTVGYLMGTENDRGEVFINYMHKDDIKLSNEELKFIELFRQTEPIYKSLVIDILTAHKEKK